MRLFSPRCSRLFSHLFPPRCLRLFSHLFLLLLLLLLLPPPLFGSPSSLLQASPSKNDRLDRPDRRQRSDEADRACKINRSGSPPKIDKSRIDKSPRLTIGADWLLGRLSYADDARFVQVAAPYTEREGLFLHRDACHAFQKMHAAAAKQGLRLKIISAARSFWQQKAIWEAKWSGSRKVEGIELHRTIIDPVKRARFILRYSAMPATSRHHWGTDIDLNALENRYFSSGKGERIYRWLQKNAAHFGFCQPYSALRPQVKGKGKRTGSNGGAAGGRSGYQEERWHWSYLPIARPLARAYSRRISYKDINGFLGAETAFDLKVIEQYVAGIAETCR